MVKQSVELQGKLWDLIIKNYNIIKNSINMLINLSSQCSKT